MKKRTIDTLRSLWSRLRYRTAIVAIVLLAVLAASLLPRLSAANSSGHHHGAETKRISQKEYQEGLKNQSTNADGSPVSGRDPASQAQSSLDSALSAPSGSGTHTDTPASGINGGGTASVPDDVYNDPSKTGISDAGCYIDYGIQGQECLPAHLANDDGSLSCSNVREHFPDGIKVTGTDRFHLDTNGDKIACGSGD